MSTLCIHKVDIMKTEDRSSAAYQSLRSSILNGDHEPGTPLFEVHLAASLGMSRTPVREALQALARDGLVEAVPNRGFVVPRRSMEDMRELFELRESLEGMAARHAAVRATKDDVDALADLCDRYEQEQDWEQWARVGTAFHTLLVGVARNTRLIGILDSLRGQIVHSRQSVLRADSERRDAAIREHRTILEAVRARDPEAAEAAARLHVRRSFEGTLFSYQNGRTTR